MSKAGAVRAAFAALCSCVLAGAVAGNAAALSSGAPGRRPSIPARAAILISADTGQQLYGLDPEARAPIASTTKLMTALVTLERVPRLSTTFRQNNYTAAAIDSQIGIAPGARMTVRDLLIALLLPSADDAAEDLAFNVGGGSVARFVAMMNARAAALGLSQTHYSTPSGLDTPGNYSSPGDLARLAQFLLAKHPFFAQTVARVKARIAIDGATRQVSNRNDLVGSVPWVHGVKTGHT
ncbi:MAG: D-alanyl-D-alanine carboxypeptidase, partial [Solirubrobacterales bacterium]|nr:D-alanyl-D-alanine carboxypeptidase [Solirubrobacterales bacterium]